MKYRLLGGWNAGRAESEVQTVRRVEMKPGRKEKDEGGKGKKRRDI